MPWSHSLCGLSSSAAESERRPPFENAHHLAATAAIVRGGCGLPRQVLRTEPIAAYRSERGVRFEHPHDSVNESSSAYLGRGAVTRYWLLITDHN